MELGLLLCKIHINANEIKPNLELQFFVNKYSKLIPNNLRVCLSQYQRVGISLEEFVY